MFKKYKKKLDRLIGNFTGSRLYRFRDIKLSRINRDLDKALRYQTGTHYDPIALLNRCFVIIHTSGIYKNFPFFYDNLLEFFHQKREQSKKLNDSVIRLVRNEK